MRYLIEERNLAWASCRQAAGALRFVYEVTLGRKRSEFSIPLPKGGVSGGAGGGSFRDPHRPPALRAVGLAHVGRAGEVLDAGALYPRRPSPGARRRCDYQVRARPHGSARHQNDHAVCPLSPEHQRQAVQKLTATATATHDLPASAKSSK